MSQSNPGVLPLASASTTVSTRLMAFSGSSVATDHSRVVHSKYPDQRASIKLLLGVWSKVQTFGVRSHSFCVTFEHCGMAIGGGHNRSAHSSQYASTAEEESHKRVWAVGAVRMHVNGAMTTTTTTVGYVVGAGIIHLMLMLLDRPPRRTISSEIKGRSSGFWALFIRDALATAENGGRMAAIQTLRALLFGRIGRL